MAEKKYRIGHVAEEAGVSIRTVRYYEEFGLLSKKPRSRGNQRYYTDTDIIYVKRILELKSMGFSLDEIKKIILLKDEDEGGEKRRMELLSQYRAKLSESIERKKAIEAYMKELDWHIKQLESVNENFQSCPGEMCRSCRFKKRCSFYVEC